jgi:hypothetical protein
MKRMTLQSGFLFVLGCLSMAPAIAQPFENDFNGLSIGESRGTVLALMGPPTASVEGFMLGVQRAEVRWVVGGRTYVVDFVMDRLSSKRVCQAMPSC